MEEISILEENVVYGSVESVNGQSGVVNLTTEDIPNTSNYQTLSEVNSKVSAEATARQNSDNAINQSINNLSGRVTTNTQNISNIQSNVNSINSAINKEVMAEIEITGNTSTDTINLKNGKVNIKTGTTTSAVVPFPVASNTTAGVMNSATFRGLQQTTDIANGLLNGAVAVSELSATPTQAQLTAAWKTATGRTTLMNRAVLYDITNSKLWTYYTNTSTWYSAAAGGGSVDVQPWTNSQAGIVKGSTEDGQIFAENDGTGSVNGWDDVKTDIENLESAGYQTESDVQGIIAETNVSDLADGEDYATTASVDAGLATKQDAISDLETIRSNAALGATALQEIPSNYVTNTDYATSSVGGVIRTTGTYASGMTSSGQLRSEEKTYAQYASLHDNAFIAKGTLENVIEGKGLAYKTEIPDVSNFITKSVNDLNNYYNKTQTDELLDEKQDVLQTEEVTQVSIDTTVIQNSSNLVTGGAVYNAISAKQNKTDNDLQTTSKQVVGAINELNSLIGNVESLMANLYNGGGAE